MTNQLHALWMTGAIGLTLALPVGFGLRALTRKLRVLARILRARAAATAVIERNAGLFAGLADALQKEPDPTARTALLAGFAHDPRLLASLGELSGERASRKLDRATVEPAHLIERALRQLTTGDALAARVELRTTQTRKLRADTDRLVLALGHLLANATAAAGPEGRLWIDCRDVERGDRPFVAVTIGNSGSYIPEAQRAVIFEPFYSAGKGTAPGLGLAVVRRIAQLHGGTVEVRSSADAGTEFTLTLPAALSPSRYRPQCVNGQTTLSALVEALAPAHAWGARA